MGDQAGGARVSDLTLGAFALAVAAFALAGFVKGVIGLGLPTLSLGILSFVMPPAKAASLLIAPSLITNIQQMRPWATLKALVARLWPMLAGVLAGTLAGSGWLSGPNTKAAAAGLGAALVVYAGLGLAKVKFSVRRANETWLGPLVGVATGLVTAATGVFVIPAVPYLQAIGLEKDDLVQALGLSFFVSTLALWGALALGGAAGSGSPCPRSSCSRRRWPGSSRARPCADASTRPRSGCGS